MILKYNSKFVNNIGIFYRAQESSYLNIYKNYLYFLKGLFVNKISREFKKRTEYIKFLNVV